MQRAAPTPEKHCKLCGAKLERKRFGSRLEDLGSFKKRKFCNQACMAASMTGSIKVLNDRNSRRQSAKTVAEKCSTCGRDSSRLSVHHVDGNPMNNSALNLLTLCGSCHRRSHSPNYTEMGQRRTRCEYCEKPSCRLGMCSTHLTRLKRHGHPLAKKVKRGSKWVLTRVTG